ncbi:MAG: tRNA 5-methoxyuridine(34)/uridine 5-oxyacetic acid(34) synthase CmoB [Gammaproteobacteria bacterium]|nr:tRNA 5-methoxyuridine(34)/uridine 5-oxyacetic acid(34) synthase CmoB [Gammaproteobacteria bacterium]MYD77159.1 tRNA 5-methoxyuridine(34)/uridine 5-oxyacetic acid(34) synthase CmoB [Gammaproteobacteria bacterium]
MLEPRTLAARLHLSPLDCVADPLRIVTAEAIAARRHGLLNRWRGLLSSLPEARPGDRDFGSGTVRIGNPDDMSKSDRETVRGILKQLHPWRKGPFELFGIDIDAEWRSNLKWARLQGKIAPLRNRLVLDVGCGNGYYMFRMLGEGARFVLGIDPSMLFLAQFSAILKYVPDIPAALLPLRSEEFPAEALRGRGVEFDSVFSMGILYHRRNPGQHLAELGRVLLPGGELIVETLVINESEGEILVPDGTYAKMPNVWGIPSIRTLEKWLAQGGFDEVRALDVSPTLADEQRRTPWMTFESLDDFLDPDDPGRTVEGYPAPVRAMISAKKR